MTDHIHWKVSVQEGPTHIGAMAQGRDANTELANTMVSPLLIDPTQYGVPEDVPRDKIWRVCRVKAQPKGKGGGSITLKTALGVLDKMGCWTVLEASPYLGQSESRLYAFYEKHGYRHNPDERGLMFWPPGGPTS